MEFNTGKKTIKVDPGSRVRIFSTSEFTAYGQAKGKRTGILGPPNASVRTWSLRLPLEFDAIEIKTLKSTEWTLDWVSPDKKETPDPIPIETTVEKPLTLREEMKRYIRTEMSHIAEKNEMETEEEANDFEMDEDDEFTSPYEIHDMVDEEIDPLPDPPEEPQPALEADPSTGHIPPLDPARKRVASCG